MDLVISIVVIQLIGYIMLPKRSALIANAQLSGSAGRYKEMVDYMEQLVTLDMSPQIMLTCSYTYTFQPTEVRSIRIHSSPDTRVRLRAGVDSMG
ncbi:hypothetical protein AHF37_06181 [Paragonimus kellicotti]|nr:hypothetical protein AHF37_06181 [Paragonimus kellicotti]